MMFFVPSTFGFIPSKWKDDGSYPYGSWPQDAVLLTAEEYAEYWGQSAPLGKTLGAVSGRPAWIDLPEIIPTADDIRSKRDQLLSGVYDRGVLIVQRLIRISDKQDSTRMEYLNGKLSDLDNYATALQDIPSQQSFPSSVTWPTIPTV